MEIIQSRYGLDRTIEKIDTNRLRVMGESEFQRTAQNEEGKITMFDFEGGPCLSLGGEMTYQKIKWVIRDIKPVPSNHPGLSECILTVEAKY